MINKLNIKYIFMMFYLCHLNAQDIKGKVDIANNSQSLKRTYTDDISGNLFLNINIWGTQNSGNLSVLEGSDMVDVLSIIGGPIFEYNYSKIKIIREYPNENNTKIVFVDMSVFFKNGDRSSLPKILPNDTIIFKKKIRYSLYSRLAELSTTVTILTVILNIFLLR